MKKVLLSLFSLGIIGLLNAQTTYLDEDFEEIEDFPLGWQNIDADGDGYTWGILQVTDQAGDPVTPLSAISRSWLGSEGALTPDNWLILPAIDLSAEEGTVTLEYETLVPAFSWDEEHYSIYVATSDDPTALEAADLQMSETLGDENNTGTPVSHTFDLSSMAGESTVYIAIRHHDVTDMDYIAFDYLLVSSENLGTVDLLNQQKLSTIYPNPAKDVVNVRLAEGFDAAKTAITLTNVSGKTVAQFKSVEDVNVANLPAGVYILTLTDGNKTESRKLIKK